MLVYSHEMESPIVCVMELAFPISRGVFFGGDRFFYDFFLVARNPRDEKNRRADGSSSSFFPVFFLCFSCCSKPRKQEEKNHQLPAFTPTPTHSLFLFDPPFYLEN